MKPLISDSDPKRPRGRTRFSRPRLATSLALRVAVIAVLFSGNPLAAESPQWIHEPDLAFNEKGNHWMVAFELDSLTDVEVAIVDPANDTVVRHLAAGVLGPKAPPPLISNSRAQKIPWDGKDDDGQPVQNASNLVVRVRAGMSV